MEINNNLIEKLKSQAEELNPFKFNTIIDCINALLEYSNGDKIYVIKYQGKEIYSFMSEEEMYRVMLNMSKEEFVKSQQQKIEDAKKDEAKMKSEAENILKTKFPKYKKIYEESFPKDRSQQFIESIEKDLKNGDVFSFSRLEERVKLLEAAKTRPMREVEKLYYEYSTNLENRMITFSELIYSYYADVFMTMVTNDCIEMEKVLNKTLSENEIDEIILSHAKKVRESKALAAEAFKKQDAMSFLKSKIKKAVNGAEKSPKTSNNLDILLGDKTSEKGKTQKSNQKD